MARRGIFANTPFPSTGYTIFTPGILLISLSSSRAVRCASCGLLYQSSVVSTADRIEAQLAMLILDRDQLAAGEFLGRPAFIGIDVGEVSADDGVVGIGKRLQAKAVCRGAVEDDEDLDVVSEMFFELAD